MAKTGTCDSRAAPASAVVAGRHTQVWPICSHRIKLAQKLGICEANRIQIGWANPYENPGNVQALKPGYSPGDLNFDPLGLKPTDPAELREMQEKELSHGRLGMLAAAGFLAQEAATGATWGQGDFSFENLLLGPFFKQEAVELARDAMTFTN